MEVAGEGQQQPAGSEFREIRLIGVSERESTWTEILPETLARPTADPTESKNENS